MIYWWEMADQYYNMIITKLNGLYISSIKMNKVLSDVHYQKHFIDRIDHLL